MTTSLGKMAFPIRWIVSPAALSFAAWTAGAIWFQFETPASWILLAVDLCMAIAVLYLVKNAPLRGSMLFIVGLVAVLTWWTSLQPSNDRRWAADVAHGVTADVSGNDVTVHDIRNFDWRSPRDFTAGWETQQYRMDEIISVDLVTSTWGMPAIAHTMMSFGFADGRHLVFSAEVRREDDEEFSEIGGFFKKFELVLVAAEEKDIIRLRTNVRGETVSLFRLRLSQAQARELFMSYLRMGNQLSYEPQFYQTLTSNCTTSVFKLARMNEPGIPMDWRILLSGYLPDYLYDQHALLSNLPLADIKRRAAITERAQQASPADYSSVIRRSVP